MTARLKLPLVRETRRLIFADANDSAFLSNANALVHCLVICVYKLRFPELANKQGKYSQFVLISEQWPVHL